LERTFQNNPVQHFKHYPEWKKDPLGQALLAYQAGNADAKILTWSDLEGYDYLPGNILFRSREGMSYLEQLALDSARGKVLDLGAGAGSHSLELQKRSLDVTALDYSAGAAQVMKMRGVQQIVQQDLWQFNHSGFDTVLALMNGIGLAGDLPGLTPFLKKVKSWLIPGGQFILDSADLIYLFTDVPGGQYVDLSKNYYGESIYRMKYGEARSEAFGWLFVDFATLAEVGHALGFHAECLHYGEEYEFLARLTAI
jgi:SAM-dependent methyltransferase